MSDLKPQPPVLKYFFTAEFMDGTIVQQQKDDSSLLGGRNSYSDVLLYQKQGKKLKRFSICNKDIGASVNLITGIFTVNGVELLLESEKVPRLPDEFELIWYHQGSKSVDVTYKLKTGEPVKMQPHAGEFREYFIGWKCTINGKSYQQKLAIS